MTGEGLRAVPTGNSAAPPYTQGPYEWDQHVTFQKMGVDSYNRYCLEEHFDNKPGINGDMTIDPNADSTVSLEAFVIANVDFEIVGTNGITADVTFATTDGALLMTTEAGAGSQVIITPHLNTAQTGWASILWGNENQVIWEAVVRTGASVASVTLWAGLKLTNDQDIATDDDQSFFRFDGNVANWEAVNSVGGVSDVETVTGVVVAVDTTYYFRIEIDSSRKAHFFINNKEVHISTALTNDVNLIPYVGVEGQSKTFNLVKTRISRIIFE